MVAIEAAIVRIMSGLSFEGKDRYIVRLFRANFNLFLIFRAYAKRRITDGSGPGKPAAIWVQRCAAARPMPLNDFAAGVCRPARAARASQTLHAAETWRKSGLLAPSLDQAVLYLLVSQHTKPVVKIAIVRID
jgi:hypothetical protein